MYTVYTLYIHLLYYAWGASNRPPVPYSLYSTEHQWTALYVEYSTLTKQLPVTELGVYIHVHVHVHVHVCLYRTCVQYTCIHVQYMHIHVHVHCTGICMFSVIHYLQCIYILYVYNLCFVSLPLSLSPDVCQVSSQGWRSSYQEGTGLRGGDICQQSRNWPL